MEAQDKAIQLFQLIEKNKFNSLLSNGGMDKDVRHFDNRHFIQIYIASVAFDIESYQELDFPHLEKSLWIKAHRPGMICQPRQMRDLEP